MSLNEQAEMTPTKTTGPHGSVWPFLVSLVILAGMAFFAWAFCRGPKVTSAFEKNLPKFSARSAITIVQDLTGDGIPHPAGTGQNEIVRTRLENRITELGISFELQHAQHHVRRDPRRAVVQLENVLFRIDADDPADDRMLIMIVSHYDSTENGPGAADAASGVSVVMEVARLVKITKGRKHDVLFLITDGEESGLLGASRFVEENLLAKDVDICINLEARGTSGPSLMFQTGPGNLELVRLMSKHIQRPFTGSLFDTIYRTLPNGTDFTEFMNVGIRGYNFAFIKSANNYHTPDDKAANLDMQSLQHHGDNAWQMTKALMALPERLGGPRGGSDSTAASAVWFDLLGWKVIWWPASWSIWLCVAAWLGWLAGMFRGRKHSHSNDVPDSSAYQFVFAFAISMGLVFTALVLNGSIELALRLDDGMRVRWPDGLVAPAKFLAFACSAIAILTGWVVIQNRKQVSATWYRNLTLSTVGLWLIAATASAIFLPGGVYLFLVPGGLAAIACCIQSNSRVW